MESIASRLVPGVINGEQNVIRQAWDKLHRLPGGRLVFSRAVGMAAPYTASIGARVEELRHGYARVTMADRRAVRNHLQCVHAVALANLVELTGNIAVAYTQPDDARFIVAGMEVDYIKKARGRITGTCHCPTIESADKNEYRVAVELVDPQGELVVRGALRTLVGPKPR